MIFVFDSFQSLGMHILGKETLVSEEEIAVAVGNVGRGARGNRPCSRDRSASDDYR